MLRKCVWAVVFAVAGVSSVRADYLSDTLGSAGGYAVLSTGSGNKIDLSLVTVNGSIGIGPGGSMTVMAPSVVNGNVYVDPSSSVSNQGHINGSVITQSMSGPVSSAVSAASTFAAMTPTQTFGSITSPTTITGTAGVNVIKINGNITSSLNFSGPAGAQFIVNVSGSINLVGSTAIGTGVPSSEVVFNLTGNGSVNTHVGNVIDGTVLDPSGTMTLDGTFNGELIGNNITLMSGAVVNGPTTPPSTPSVPEPASMILMALGGLGLAGYRKLRRGQQQIAPEAAR